MLSINKFLTDEIIKENDIGPGSDVFMVGRFITHQGIQRNTPSVRFGNISMMFPEPIPHPTRGIMQESFLVEMRSLTGYSGSPVIVYLPLLASFGELKLDTVPHMAVLDAWLLGVVWGHFDLFEKVLEKDSRTAITEGWTVKTNSGIAQVVPVSKIRECLEVRELVEQREKSERELSKQTTEGITLDVNTPDFLTETDFE